jgi:hypothetical protein
MPSRGAQGCLRLSLMGVTDLPASFGQGAMTAREDEGLRISAGAIECQTGVCTCRQHVHQPVDTVPRNTLQQPFDALANVSASH